MSFRNCNACFSSINYFESVICIFKAFILLLPVALVAIGIMWLVFWISGKRNKIVYQPVEHIMIGLELMNLLKKAQENGLVM